ncbi:MAG: hypothetical protein K2Q03_00235 [Sphingobacteriaceae bacterium]|nr:hypothetical protein [Sphingobacteriaceae bacterium]
MKSKIETLAQLQQEIKRLEASCNQQEVILKQDVTSYFKQFTLAKMFKNYIFPKSKDKESNAASVSSQVLSFLLPYLLNKTIFKNSSMLTKTITTLVSGRFSSFLTLENVLSVVAEIKNLFNKKQQAPHFADYGIPPDSETY